VGVIDPHFLFYVIFINMNYKKLVRQIINEIIDDAHTPVMKYYAFDWDDNLMYMPTKIYLKDNEGRSVGMSTEDFAEYRTEIGNEDFEYEGHTIVGFDENPFRDFRVTGDKKFLEDAMKAPTGPAWPDFIEAINNGSIFSIVTARGHTPSILKQGVYNLIKKNMHGLNSNQLAKNLLKYRNLADEDKLTKDQLIRAYLDMCRFYPVSFGEGSATNPEQAKIDAMEEFVDYVKLTSKNLQSKAMMKNKINNYFTPFIGFSDDDVRNVESMKKHFDKKEDNILKTYLTAGGEKKQY
jgi:hypothetical protein